ncbi:fatty acid oxidation complex subunit alpha FadB [Haliangium ochraceum]|uniref:enoyl-CoA hydratase n=1 Tax=Haliangium ochraceum (strain DSM 14365 / JCM 11303 / SMP-2) TaxID=502025 RepID=D0LWW3_HALO1|nr:fatty acid oxidation complex subunit alpha FadB [Haliangium ochraceum]ACY14210.1 3-hydroxyacyl-CoA dehydrogenase NAD-binding protein [Haliangium ochraceum DSM 14365]
MFQGQSLRVTRISDHFAEICFDREGEAINKLDKRTVDELGTAVSSIADDGDVRGVLITSAKKVFIVGADITEFGALFALPVERLVATNSASNSTLTALESLPVPCVVALGGVALGGGLELALAADFRVMSTAAQVGLPEVQLGLFPGFGGTVRLPRIAGAAVAIEWITSGASAGAEAALAAGVVDEVCAPEKLRERALTLLRTAVAGERDWHARRRAKDAPLPLKDDERAALFGAAREQVARRAPKHQPAAMSALEAMARAATAERTRALEIEARAFAEVAKTQAADALVQTFLSGQQVKKITRGYRELAAPVARAAVLGAGIMGGGIAYTSALRGVRVILKDIAQAQLERGMDEARGLLGKRVKRGKMNQEQADAVLGAITPQLDYTDFDQVDVVVEAVSESLALKHQVLAEVEAQVREGAILASNTSSLRIDELAPALARPENLVGMHFFNPVPAMPLVEIIRGSRTSPAALATVVGYAEAMGKTPIVVADGPGFLVNRVLTPYMQAFAKLVADGADFVQVDAAMEAFGWPMGPAYLNDVVGMDTAVHVAEIIIAGFPERMARMAPDPLALMVERGRLGQKSGLGFYRYQAGAGGRPEKSVAEDSRALLAALQEEGSSTVTDGEIVERMMLPMIFEAAQCLEEGVVGSAPELDLAMLLGVGFPAYLGGPLKYADWLGARELLARAQRYAHLGPQYTPPRSVRDMAEGGKRFYPRPSATAS